MKPHALFDLESDAIQAMEASPEREHEGKHLVEPLADLDEIECFVGDAAFFPRTNCKLVAERGGTLYIKPKKNSTIRAKECWPWRRMVTLFRKHPPPL